MSDVCEAREWLVRHGFDVVIDHAIDGSRCWADLIWVENPGFVVRRYSSGRSAEEATLQARRRFERALASQMAPSARS